MLFNLCMLCTESDFNRTSLVIQGSGIFTLPGALNDSTPELSEGFIYFLDVDRNRSDPEDYDRLQFLNRHILAIIEDDDGKCWSMHLNLHLLFFSSQCYL